MIRRIAVVLAVPTVVHLARLLVVPGLERNYLSEVAARVDLSLFSVVALGLNPFVSASLIVELFAQLAPRWRRRRHGDPIARAKLTRAALIGTLALCVTQSLGMMNYAASVGLIAEPSMATEAVFVVSMTAGTFALVAAARFIERFGLGNGVAVLIGLPLVVSVIDQIRLMIAILGTNQFTPANALLRVAGLTAIVAITVFALRRGRIDAISGVRDAQLLQVAYRAATPLAHSNARSYAWIPGAGIIPLQVAAHCMGFVDRVAQTPALVDSMRSFTGPVADFAIRASIVVALTPLFFKWFTGRTAAARVDGADDVVSVLQACEPDKDRVQIAAAYTVDRARSLRLTFAYLVGLVFLDSALVRLDASVPGSLIVLAAIALDLTYDARARLRRDDWVAAWTEHRACVVDPVLALLARTGITAHARGLHLRMLLQFFAPYVPIEILVPRDQADEARALIEPILGRPAAARASGAE